MLRKVLGGGRRVLRVLPRGGVEGESELKGFREGV